MHVLNRASGREGRRIQLKVSKRDRGATKVLDSDEELGFGGDGRWHVDMENNHSACDTSQQMFAAHGARQPPDAAEHRGPGRRTVFRANLMNNRAVGVCELEQQRLHWEVAAGLEPQACLPGEREFIDAEMECFYGRAGKNTSAHQCLPSNQLNGVASLDLTSLLPSDKHLEPCDELDHAFYQQSRIFWARALPSLSRFLIFEVPAFARLLLRRYSLTRHNARAS
jgi:hypothetical protein